MDLYAEKERLKPRLHCSFDPNDPLCVIAPTGTVAAKMFAVKVTADGVGKVSSCSARLTALTQPDGHVVHIEAPIPFAPGELDGLAPKDIICGDKRYVALIHIKTMGNEIGIMTVGPRSVDMKDNFSEYGRYLIGFRLVSPEAAAVERAVIFNWTGDWKTSAMASQ